VPQARAEPLGEARAHHVALVLAERDTGEVVQVRAHGLEFGGSDLGPGGRVRLCHVSLRE
jgi:hypothetical protein